MTEPGNNHASLPLCNASQLSGKDSKQGTHIGEDDEDDTGANLLSKGDKASRLAFSLAFLSICLSSFLSALDLVSALPALSLQLLTPPFLQTTIPTALPTIVADLPFRRMRLDRLPKLEVDYSLEGLAKRSGPGLCAALSSPSQGGRFIWIGTAYALAGTALMPWTGTLAQIWGRKNLFLISVTMFAVGSAICGSSSTLGMLIAGRGERREKQEAMMWHC